MGTLAHLRVLGAPYRLLGAEWLQFVLEIHTRTTTVRGNVRLTPMLTSFPRGVSRRGAHAG
jgi:hypothetical protein